MARPKQTPNEGVAAATTAMDHSDNSGSDDDIVAEVQRPKATLQPKKGGAAEGSRLPTSKQTTKAANGALKGSKGKGKATAEALDADAMDVDVPGGKKWINHTLSGSTGADISSLRRENELIVEQNEQLRQALSEVMEAVKPSAREEALQTEIDSLNALLRRQQTLLELRNSEYTKSRLINRNPTEPADWVTVDWAEAQRDKAVAELTTQMNKLTARVEKAEKGRKDAEREGAEAQRQVAIVQRELDVEVANSKKLQAEIGRRPNISQPTPVAGSSSLGKKAGPGALELEKKLELFEDLSSLSIISYVEAVEQPGNVKKVSYTCLLSVEDKEFPFKLVIWDERVAPVKGEETEHVVYSPGEPLDPDLDIGYLAQSFTFPRSQMHVFYQNMLNVLTDMGQDAQEEGEEEEEEE